MAELGGDAATVACIACNEQTPMGKPFCINCGSPLRQQCPACGQSVRSARFCAHCGTRLVAEPAEARGPSTPAPRARFSERRVVSVLFGDLVGFTTLSEDRDSEDVAGLLEMYFARARSLVERYGGTVEKFIGDAVVAAWGTQVAREDDAERAVRTALSLTRAVRMLARETGVDPLQIRVAVVTARTAVELGDHNESTILGDQVDIASRLQSLAAPGTVLVDEATRRGADAAIVYEDAGTQQLENRKQLRAWRALRVVTGPRGTGRGRGIEVPFVGRERELEQIIVAAQETINSGRTRLMTVVGETGIGKSRLLSEYRNYSDAIEHHLQWHFGRCLSYGKGVSYWALAEMVRARVGILEEEDPLRAGVKLRATIERYVPSERERRLVEPRLAHLLGLERREASDSADLFSGWRLFFERVSEVAPVVLAFEDLHWADSGLLDFIDYLLEWSDRYPLFMVALGRPDLLIQRPGWASEAIHLQPLSDHAMREALSGVAPDLSEDLLGRILRRANGVPLYAVETVRMLLDRGLLADDGTRYAVTGDLEELDVPETLHAIAAARLDGLSPRERAIIQNASVYGQSFTAAGVAALSDSTTAEVRHVLDRLVLKQVLTRGEEAPGVERDEYRFLQDVLRTTAYSILSRRDRKGQHLAAARYLQDAWGDAAGEVAEIIAAHLLDAANAEPEALDAGKIRSMACETLVEAGRRALSLALGPEAVNAFDRAAELTNDDHLRAELLEQSGRAALLTLDSSVAQDRLERARKLFEAGDDRAAGARCLAALARVLFREDRLDMAIDISRRAAAGLPGGSAEQAAAFEVLAKGLGYSGQLGEAVVAADAALAIAEPSEQWRTIVETFQTIAHVRQLQGRPQESFAFRERALALALEHDLTEQALRAYVNVADWPLQQDEFAQSLAVAQRGLALAHTRGDREWVSSLQLLIASAQVPLGEWDELPAITEDGHLEVSGVWRFGFLPLVSRVQAARGDTPALERTLALAAAEGTSNVAYAPGVRLTQAIALNGLDRPADALPLALPIAVGGSEILNEDRREAFIEAGLAAWVIGDEAALHDLARFVAVTPAVRLSPVVRALGSRFAGLLAYRHGDSARADELLATAAAGLRAVATPFYLSQALTERAEILAATGQAGQAQPLLSEAHAALTELNDTPWRERAEKLLGVLASV
jgi:class 3 adenylate cyclase/tetratricopeptide (TPR) repeat protein